MKIQDRYEYDPQKDLLGKGGFARVFRAQDTLLHREVALKVFSNAGTHQYSVLAEIRKVIGLEHPNLLRYYDVVMLEGQNPLGESEQTQIGVMELANAGDLKDFARTNPGSPLLYKLLKDVLLGLEYLHSKGIIHRDLKAQNILLVKQDGVLTAKISDFGISKDTGSGGQSSSMMVGTIEYMAPEQFSPAKYGIDGKVSSNLDLWSFGIMVHELLTDTTPFGSRDGETTAEQIMAQILSTEMPDGIDRLPEPYKSVVKKCLVTNAKERIRRASELLNYFDDRTQINPTSQSANNSDNSTKLYPKTGSGVTPTNRLQEQETKIYSAGAIFKNGPQARIVNKKPALIALAALVIIVGGAGWWFAGDYRTKVAVEKIQVKVENKNQSIATSAPLKIAFVYAGPIGDAGWTYAHELGRKAIDKEFGDKVKTSFIENVPETEQAEKTFKQLAAESNQIIFGTTFGYMTQMLKVSSEFKNIKFEHATGYKSAVNMRAYNSKMYEGAYLAGIVAGKMTKSNTLGVVGAIPVPEVIRNINSFTLGAQSVNPKIKTKVVWVNSWFKPPFEAEAASALIAAGADVLIQTTDSSAVIKTAEAKGVRSIGWESDMTAYSSKAHLGSVVNNWRPYYIKTIKDVMESKWASSPQSWGVKEGAVDLVGLHADVPAEVKQKLDEVKANLKAGTYQIWKGPILDNRGKLVLHKDILADEKFMDSMLFYIKGVEGKVPGQ